MKIKKKHIIIPIIIIAIILILVYYTNKEKENIYLYGAEYKEKLTVKTKTGLIKDIPLTFSQWFEPYNEKDKTNYSKITTKKYGVYFIRDKATKENLYIGHSKSNLYKALYRHYQYYNDSDTQARNNYERHETEVMLATSSKANAYKLERHFILEYNPKDVTHKYEAYQEEEKTQTIPDIESVDTWDELDSETIPDEIKEEDLPF